MAKRWVELGTQVISLNCVLDYIEAQLRSYAKLLRFKVEPPSNTWEDFNENSTIMYFMRQKNPTLEKCQPYF